MDFECRRFDSAAAFTVSVQQWAADCLLLTSESQGWNYSASFEKCCEFFFFCMTHSTFKCKCKREANESSQQLRSCLIHYLKD